MTLNSKIIISKNIKMDRDYYNVLSYNESQILSLVENNAVASANNYSFIRERNTILVNFTYQQCLSCNYIAFQNKDYSNKWFFAWIDEVNYKSNSATEIKFTIDVWSTWFDYWNPVSCYVIREHVNDDTIGLHTVPEGLETGDYVLNERKEDFMNDRSDFAICMAVTELPDESVPEYSNNRVYNGIFGGLYYLAFDTAISIENAIKMYDKLNKSDAINSIFLIPKNLSSYQDGVTHVWSIQSLTSTVIYLAGSNTSDTIGNITTTFPSKLGNNYIPKNKKLFTYPYCYINLTNNSGMTETFRYEDFRLNESGVPNPSWWVDACLSPGMSLKAIPLYYKNENINFNYGIVGGKLPVCSWQTDVYLNWLRQSGLNPVFELTSGILATGGGLATYNPGAVIAGTSSLYNALHQFTIADTTPNQAKGNTNSGDINFSDPSAGIFTVYKMSIKDEYAKIIDDYFSRYGYRINEVKVPNLTGRPYYNYIEIGNGDVVGTGSVPANYMKIINDSCRRGITIWHSHSNLGNFNVDNSLQ